MAKVTFELEVELEGDMPFYAIDLRVQRDVETNFWEKALLFSFGRGHKVREGKYLRLNSTEGKVVNVGEMTEDEINLRNEQGRG